MDKFFEKIVYIVCFLRIYLVFILWNLTLRSSLKLHCTSYHWVSNCRTLRTSSFLILLRWSCIHLIWWLISPWNLINLIFLFFFFWLLWHLCWFSSSLWPLLSHLCSLLCSSRSSFSPFLSLLSLGILPTLWFQLLPIHWGLLNVPWRAFLFSRVRVCVYIHVYSFVATAQVCQIQNVSNQTLITFSQSVFPLIFSSLVTVTGTTIQ